ncbi:phosphotransferase [Streptomyces sp. NPDC088147]|uniref:phosphotransferase n=1 Tax=Streptomyces sp. NPDC088147 TaxID=3365830 RepID=UPI003821E40A
MTERVPWDQLPAGLRTAIEDKTGTVTASTPVTQGLNCTTAQIITTRGNGPLFLKGVRDTDLEGASALRWEEHLTDTVGGVSPSIRHALRAAGWYCLAFVYVDGRNADLGPESADLDAVAFTIRRMHRLRTPDIPIPPLADRFTGYLMPGEAEALAGGHLLHTDTNPHNILVSNRGGTAYIVDWAMPAVGPEWVDAAYTAVRLMEYGHTPASALAWLRGIPSWRSADPKAVDALVTVTCRRWSAVVGTRGAAASNERFQQLLA